MTVNEVFAGFEWIDATLMADAALATLAVGGLWRGMAPPGTATPFLVMALMASTDTVTMNAYRILTEAVFMIKAVGPALASAQIAAAAARVDDLLGKPPVTGSVPGGYIAASYRESTIAIDELVAGELIFNMGGLYRLQLMQTS